jgi:alpha-beta hydrolase superfamily lysophospholipase
VLFCFPGGGMSRAYFDLAAPGYSFAEWAAARGYVVVLVDHPAVGESDVPEDGWSLTPDTIAAVEAVLVERVLAQLRAGELSPLPAIDPTLVVGVAHSAGGGLLIRQQADHAPYDAIAPLGWAGRGLPEYLTDEEKTLADKPDLTMDDLVAFAKARGDDPLPMLRRGSSPMLVHSEMPPDVHRALVAARTRLLVVAGHSSIIPGVTRLASVRVSVPVFLGVGDHDIARDAHRIPAEFPSSPDVTLYVLADAGHNHNVEPTRELLWERLDAWLHGLLMIKDSTSDYSGSIVIATT